MAYAYKGGQQPAPVASVEQARRHNAALHAELRTLAAERADIAAHVKTMRAELTAARAKLSRQIRHLDAARAQQDLIEAAANFVSTLPEPIHGGRDGLQAAVDEMLAHETRGLKLAKPPRPRTGPSHGTGRKYADGCRCDGCQQWRCDKESRRRTRLKEAKEQDKAA